RAAAGALGEPGAALARGDRGRARRSPLRPRPPSAPGRRPRRRGQAARPRRRQGLGAGPALLPGRARAPAGRSPAGLRRRQRTRPALRRDRKWRLTGRTFIRTLAALLVALASPATVSAAEVRYLGRLSL